MKTTFLPYFSFSDIFENVKLAGGQVMELNLFPLISSQAELPPAPPPPPGELVQKIILFPQLRAV
jgi:hypothetical protein